jgi:hypothetical protein
MKLGGDFLCDSEVQNEIASDINTSTDGWTLHNPADPSAYHDIWMVILPAGIGGCPGRCGISVAVRV